MIVIRTTQEEATRPFNASMLSVGEMMEVTENCDDLLYKGHILLKTYNGIISLTDPEFSWDSKCSLKGKKFKKGEGVTLIQE